MLNFNTNIQEVVANQETIKRTSSFMEYNSKKKLFDASILTETQKTYIQQLKGTFTFHLHTENRYLVVTMYYSKDKKYGFLVVDLETLQCAEADSVKNAKKEVMEIIASATPETPAETTVEEPVQETAQEEEKVEETTTEEKPAKKSRSKK
jgi:hypothetical protein